MTTAKLHVDVTPTETGTEFRMMDGGAPVPVSSWPLSRHPGAEICRRLIVEDKAIEDDEQVLVEHGAVSRLTAEEARRLELPPVTMLRARVEGNGVMLRPDFRASLRWVRASGQPVIGVSRTGAWLREGGAWRRLPETLYALAEAVKAIETGGGDEAEHLRRVARLREALPPAATTGQADASGLLRSATIIEADAFSLSTSGDGDALQLVPVLHRAGTAAPLLPDDLQAEVGQRQFLRWPTARAVYALPDSTYVTVSPPLRRALEVVRRAAAGSPQQRRALLRDPRPAIREAIGDEADATLLDSLFVETGTWSERVIGLGLWQPRVLPWLSRRTQDWFEGRGETEGSSATETSGLMVGDRCIPLGIEDIKVLTLAVEQAIRRGENKVSHGDGTERVDIPASAATLEALEQLRRPVAPGPNVEHEAQHGNAAVRASGFSESRQEHLVPIPLDNFFQSDIEAIVKRRRAPPNGLPPCVATALKPHQIDGLGWLQDSYASGSPGVLLADDMGLGKTLQGLAFLAWLRDGMHEGTVERRPILIVAPTGLLENWWAEHDRHLAHPGLGSLLQAHGKGLAALRVRGADSMPTLDREQLAAADWVLTTYETLRDHSPAFCGVRFAAVLMDEAQKVKTPGIRMTDAVKALNAEFGIAVTGTPVENAVTDLWCIVDAVAPGHLGDLRRFAATYGDPDATERLKELKASIDSSFGGRPPLMKRRLKDKVLKGLPMCRQEIRKAPMASRQLAAYEAAQALARGDQGRGRILEALQRLRKASLCADFDDDADDAFIVEGSVRLRLALEALDGIHKRDERALVFVDNLAFKARLAGLIQRRYGLRETPMAIDGRVAGHARQSRVDRFQAALDGFGVMLLSPRAGGVGLTLTRANHVIHLSRWWNPAVEDQATARVHRIGQERPVTVHLPLATLPDGGRSFDDNLHALLESKRSLMHDLLLPPECSIEALAAMLEESL